MAFCIRLTSFVENSSMPLQYFLLYKPFGYLSQFTQEVEGQKTLADLCGDLPPDVYPIGRLDKDSEGLLLLSNDKALNHRLLNPTFKHERSYLVQVEGVPTEEALEQLRSGVDIRVNKKVHRTAPAKALLLDQPPTLPDRDPPIRFRANIPTAWLELRLTEGKNRQVRRMCAKVGYPTLRLVRWSIERLALGDLPLGQHKEIDRKSLMDLLGIS